MRIALLITVLSVALQGAEPVASTSWDVRRAAKELLDDLEHHRGDDGSLLERAQTLMSENGTALIELGKPPAPGTSAQMGPGEDAWNPGASGSAPIADVITAKLRQLGLEDAFIASYQPVAARKLAELGSQAPSARLVALARGFPGTAAAHQAWVVLSDRAWDAGHLNEFLEYAGLAGDCDLPATAQRRQRVQAALGMILPQAAAELPPNLDGLTELWRVPVEQRRASAQLPTIERQQQQEGPVAPQALSIAATPGEAAAVSDGMRLLVIDHLIGRAEGIIHRLGNTMLSAHQSRPLPVPEGFVALGYENNQLLLVCVDHSGNERWRYQSAVRSGEDAPNGGNVQQMLGVSAPVLLDHLVVVATIAQSPENLTLQLHAVDARTGALAWTVDVARMPGMRRQFQMGNGTFPSVCVQSGSLLVLSNNGVLARVGADGSVERIWSYPSTLEEVNAGLPQLSQVDRQGGIASDGITAVATPSDNSGLTLLITGSHDPEVYRGDGAGGDVLAVSNGIALLCSRYLTCIDLASRSKRWDMRMRSAVLNPQALVGGSDILMFSNNDLMLLALKDGSLIGERTIEARSNLLVVDQSLIFGGADFVAAYGSSASTLDQIVQDAKSHPADFRPRVRLAGLLQAHGDAAGAYAAYLEALRLGAPPDYAERAVRSVRERLELAVGDPASFKAAITQLEGLAPYDPQLGPESAWWRGRDSEARGDAPAAATCYQQAAASPPHLVELRDGVLCDLPMLARAGLGRLKLLPGSQLQAGLPESPWPEPASAWLVKGNHAASQPGGRSGQHRLLRRPALRPAHLGRRAGLVAQSAQPQARHHLRDPGRPGPRRRGDQGPSRHQRRGRGHAHRRCAAQLQWQGDPQLRRRPHPAGDLAAGARTLYRPGAARRPEADPQRHARGRPGRAHRGQPEHRAGRAGAHGQWHHRRHPGRGARPEDRSLAL